MVDGMFGLFLEPKRLVLWDGAFAASCLLALALWEHASVTALSSFLDAKCNALTLDTAIQLGDARQGHRLRTLTWRASPISFPSPHYLGAHHTELVSWKRTAINKLQQWKGVSDYTTSKALAS